jgi:uncharacterized protein (TIGR02594 family)
VRHIETSAYLLAQRFVGSTEIPGKKDNPMILAMLRLDDVWPEHDEVPWCSAFLNFVCWLLRLPRSKSLRARSWLLIGEPVKNADAQVGFDVVILKRGGEDQPGPEVIEAPGHVGLFGGWSETGSVYVLAGNQGDSVNVMPFPSERILGIRRLL